MDSKALSCQVSLELFSTNANIHGMDIAPDQVSLIRAIAWIPSSLEHPKVGYRQYLSLDEPRPHDVVKHPALKYSLDASSNLSKHKKPLVLFYTSYLALNGKQ
ncbi:hypothetical protein [Nodosilinea sp. P-1105]|uniref:hypothetical protein n=1 Tax=Nodosilinea sp. P-1105 TaxID=2546229 RepID=UPI001469A6C0|nr:hypothetical protein [Nodosilinea sp. P-1105]NMF83676.1 hypothetical protein [Nodosilinea sp. P-1105]